MKLKMFLILVDLVFFSDYLSTGFPPELTVNLSHLFNVHRLFVIGATVLSVDSRCLAD